MKIQYITLLTLVIAGAIAFVFLSLPKKPNTKETTVRYECSHLFSDDDIRDKLLGVATKCQPGTPGQEDLFLTITISNGDSDVSFPLDFIKSRGPSVKLINPTTKAEYNVPTMPADFSLKNKFTPIPRLGSISFDWVIYKSELERMQNENGEVHAEVSIHNAITHDGKIQEFGNMNKLLIKQVR